MSISEEVKKDYPHLAWLVDDEHDRTNEIEKALLEITELRAEIVRHHKDFERWEDMADKGAARIAENKALKDAIQQFVRMILYSYNLCTGESVESFSIKKQLADAVMYITPIMMDIVNEEEKEGEAENSSPVVTNASA